MKPVQRILCELIDLFTRLRLESTFIRVMALGYYLRFKLQNNLKLVGLKNIPASKKFILVGNHSSIADFYMVFGVMVGRLGLPFNYVTIVRDHEMRNPLFTRLLKLTGGMPKRARGDVLVRWMVKKLLDPAGGRVAIPPEGMTNKRGIIMEGFTGVVRVYHGAGRRFPILPVASIGADVAYPTEPDEDGKFRPRKHKGIIGRFGKPFHLPPPRDGIYSREFYRAQTRIVMEKIRTLALVKEPLVENWKLAQVREKYARLAQRDDKVESDASSLAPGRDVDE